MNRITLVGAGFAALTAVQKLRAADPTAEITLVAPAAEFTYLPGTIWIPSGLRQPEDLKIDLGNFFRRMRVNYHQGSASGLKAGGRILVTDQGEIENDGLIICSGGRFIKKLPGIEHAITPCEGIPAAVKIKDRLQALQGGTIAVGFSGNPKEPSAMRGGPMFEFLFGIDRQLRREGRRERFKLVFFTPAPEPGKRLGPKAVAGLLREMQKRGIETHLGHKMKQFTDSKVITEGGEFAADLILFMPGMTGNQWFDNTDLPRSEGGLIRADAQCRVEGMERVYVAGDSGSYPGPDWMPKQAHMADLQAEAAAANLLAELNGEQPTRTFKVELFCIVDSQTTGSLVARTPKYNIALPQMRAFHWMKRLFEWWYLRQYR
ncbi:NAD(P)/FAD-dependent oxidoreductase [Sedimenticola selenatireducens]|uniref:Pyridine nucleotide-disulfide oxidoreductase n=1 Tax=Sedimenticola selenatireducens TaxID=191960 RepID=A0A2N6CXP5_9GAMM|nr:FAD/NAD(P)-binding oxidoreductase [Sedimenticola selenatireducens]PLX62068.1 MAG: pyridine nucleotide-disulfide oxidoreductase [Sedimenticola selenatireducens]